MNSVASATPSPDSECCQQTTDRRTEMWRRVTRSVQIHIGPTVDGQVKTAAEFTQFACLVVMKINKTTFANEPKRNARDRIKFMLFLI